MVVTVTITYLFVNIFCLNSDNSTNSQGNLHGCFKLGLVTLSKLLLKYVMVFIFLLFLISCLLFLTTKKTSGLAFLDLF